MNYLRPTTGKVAQAIYNLLFSYYGEVQGRHVLELFAGTGGLGKIALQRECQSVTMIDIAPHHFRQNNFLPYKDKYDFLKYNLLQEQSYTALKKHLAKKKLDYFDILIMDPPYILPIEDLLYVFQNIYSLLSIHSIIILEYKNYDYQALGESLNNIYQIVQYKEYKDKSLTVFKLIEK